MVNGTLCEQKEIVSRCLYFKSVVKLENNSKSRNNDESRKSAKITKIFNHEIWSYTVCDPLASHKGVHKLGNVNLVMVYVSMYLCLIH